MVGREKDSSRRQGSWIAPSTCASINLLNNPGMSGAVGGVRGEQKSVVHPLIILASDELTVKDSL